MVLNYIKDLKKVLNEIIDKKLENVKGLDFFTVININDDMTFNIKRLNVNQQYLNVEMIGLGLGHLKGQIMIPDINDVVICGFIQNSEQPYILGSVFNNFSINKDQKLNINEGEYFVNNKANGSFILIDNNNDIKIKTPNGAKLKLSNSGGFKLFNNNNYGIECNSSGDITIYGNLTINGSVSTLTGYQGASVSSSNSKSSGNW